MGEVLRSRKDATGGEGSLTCLNIVGSPTSFPNECTMLLMLAFLVAIGTGAVELTAANVAALSLVGGGKCS